MDQEWEPEEEIERGLVLESAPADWNRPTWLVLALFVVFAFALGTGTGFGIGQGSAASPTPSAALATAAPRATEVATAVATPALDSDRWSWLERKLPDGVAGLDPEKDSGFFPENEDRTTAWALAAACGVDRGSVLWAQASWPANIGWFPVQAIVFYVPAECSPEVRLDAACGTREWTPVEIGDKTVRSLSGPPSFLYARQQMLYVIRNADLMWATQILANIP